MRGFISLSLERKMLQFVLALLVLILALQFSVQHGGRGEILYITRSLLPFLQEESLEVTSPAEGSYLLIQLMNQERERGAYLLINGRVFASFEENPLLVQVQEGDSIQLDTRGAKGILWFKILDTSEEIQSFRPGYEYRVMPHLYHLGEIKLGGD